MKPGQDRKKRTGSPMLAKRLIVGAFALLAVGLTPLAFSGERELFVKLEPIPMDYAAN
jgi:hypothetical protein